MIRLNPRSVYATGGGMTAQEGFFNMKELLYAIVSGLVEDKTAIEITQDEPNEEGVIAFHLHVAEEDMGRVIGKQGRIAKAVRVIMRSAASRNGMDSISVEIGD